MTRLILFPIKILLWPLKKLVELLLTLFLVWALATRRTRLH
jgi:hypothetical protein